MKLTKWVMWSARKRLRRAWAALATIFGFFILVFFLAAPTALASGAPPAAPSNARVTGVPGGITITWQDNSRDETAWIIYDGVTQRSFTVSNGSATGPTSYTWTGMAPNEYKCLRVRPYNVWGAGEGAPPPPQYWACTTSSPTGPPSPAPTSLVATSVQGGVQLTWQDNSPNETAWIINDGVANRFSNVVGDSTGTRAYTWTGMGSHEWKCFHVRAYNSYGTSGWVPPTGYVCAFSATNDPPPAAPTSVTTSGCWGTSANLIWEESGAWDSFRIYEGSTKVRELKQGDAALSLSGSQYFFTVNPMPPSGVSLGVSAVKSGVASSISLAQNRLC